jgi:hypothetical protein
MRRHRGSSPPRSSLRTGRTRCRCWDRCRRRRSCRRTACPRASWGAHTRPSQARTCQPHDTHAGPCRPPVRPHARACARRRRCRRTTFAVAARRACVFERTRRRAAVARRLIAVVAVFAGIDHAVAARRDRHRHAEVPHARRRGEDCDGHVHVEERLTRRRAGIRRCLRCARARRNDRRGIPCRWKDRQGGTRLCPPASTQPRAARGGSSDARAHAATNQAAWPLSSRARRCSMAAGCDSSSPSASWSAPAARLIG